MYQFIFFSLLLLAHCRTDEKPDQIIEIFRHGARSPNHNYDPSWPASQYGVLTPVGMRQHYILGKVLSEKYSHLLGPPYDYNQVYMLSDATPRCIQSALSHFYGIYLNTGPSLRDDYPVELAIPPYQDPRVKHIADSLPDSEAIPHNSVPPIVNIIDVTNAYIFQANKDPVCPNGPIWQIQNMNDTGAQEGLKIFNETINNLNALNSSLNLKTLVDLKGFGDVMLANIYDNRTLPDELDDPELISNISYAFAWTSIHVWDGQGIQRQLNSFGLVDSVLKQMANFRQGEKYNKAVLFSGHDENIMALLSAFGVITEECLLANFYAYLENKTTPHPTCYFPYFASNLVFELYNTTGSPYVKFYYNNALIPLCNGQPRCSYDDFMFFARNATGNNTINSYYEQCGTNTTKLFGLSLKIDDAGIIETYRLEDTKINNRTEMMIIFGLSLLSIMLIGKMIYDKRKYNQKIRMLRDEAVCLKEVDGIRID